MAFKYTRSCYESMEWQLWFKTIRNYNKINKNNLKKKNWPWLIVASLEPSFFSCTFQGKSLFSSLSSHTTTFFPLWTIEAQKFALRCAIFWPTRKTRDSWRENFFSWSRIKEGFYRLLSKELWKIIVRDLKNWKEWRKRDLEKRKRFQRWWENDVLLSFFWITHSFEVN